MQFVTFRPFSAREPIVINLAAISSIRPDPAVDGGYAIYLIGESKKVATVLKRELPELAQKLLEQQEGV